MIQFMPPAATLQAHIVDHAFKVILVLTAVIFCLVLGTLFYSILKFRAKSDADQGDGFHHSRGWRVEGLWIISTTALTIWLAAFGTTELRQLLGKPEADMDIQVTASQFSWEFFYPKFNQLGSRLILPLNKRIRLDITSKDVVHSFWVPEFRTKQDALPGRVSTLYLTPDRAGSYLLMCNELCGLDHTVMTAYVDVVPEADFEKQFTHGAESW
jgi:cytochrome c oxidase subunit 2